MLRLSVLCALIAAAWLPGCGRQGSAQTTGGDADRGQRRIAEIGCGACHTIPGVTGARGHVGPPLVQVGDQSIIAGKLPNTPDNLVTWIMKPQSINPGNAMPNMEVNEHDARDIAAYLYTLR